jgi:aspartokinase-like uncharacterized kinase
MVIVKLGGSLFLSPLLRGWLNRLCQLSQDEAIIIVPGGGPFANQVRLAQKQHHFDDQYAHHMALLAMSQYGLLLLGLCQQAQPFYYPKKSTESNKPGLSVWLPDKKLLKEGQLAQNWDVTSDSLSLWLAQKLKPNKLTLLKHLQNRQATSIRQLSGLGLLDTAFLAQYDHAKVPIELIDVDRVTTYSLVEPEHLLTP